MSEVYGFMEISLYKLIPCSFVWVLFLVFSIKLRCDRAVQCETAALFLSVGSRIPAAAVSVSFGISKVTRESSSRFILINPYLKPFVYLHIYRLYYYLLHKVY